MGVRKIIADKGSLDALAICKANCPKESYTESKGEYQILVQRFPLSYSDAPPFSFETSAFGDVYIHAGKSHSTSPYR